MIISIREILTANRTYYVRVDGSDSNNGLTNSASGAFLTINHAFDVIDEMVDLAGYAVTIQVGPGTYTDNIFRSTAVDLGQVTLLGDTTTPANVVLAPPSGIIVQVTNGSALTIAGFKMVSTVGSSALFSYDVGILTVSGRMEFGANAAVQVARQGHVVFQTGYTISGGGTFHYLATMWGSIAFVSGAAITVTGTPNFSNAFAAASAAVISTSSGGSFTGAATGRRYSVLADGVINTAGGGANFFPGSTAGTVTTGGQYV